MYDKQASSKSRNGESMFLYIMTACLERASFHRLPPPHSPWPSLAPRDKYVPFSSLFPSPSFLWVAGDTNTHTRARPKGRGEQVVMVPIQTHFLRRRHPKRGEGDDHQGGGGGGGGVACAVIYKHDMVTLPLPFSLSFFFPFMDADGGEAFDKVFGYKNIT